MPKIIRKLAETAPIFLSDHSLAIPLKTKILVALVRIRTPKRFLERNLEILQSRFRDKCSMDIAYVREIKKVNKNFILKICGGVLVAFSVNLSVVEVGGLLDNLEKTFPGKSG